MSSDLDEAMNPTSGLDSDGHSDSDSDNQPINKQNHNHSSTHQQPPNQAINSTASSHQPQTSDRSLGSSSSSYLAAVAARNGALPKPILPAETYSIEPQLTIPHSTQVNALAAPACFSHIYSAGADGFVRRHAMGMLNSDRPGWANTPRTNLYAKPFGGVDGRQAVLTGYWENEEAGAWVAELAANAGPQGTEARAAADHRTRWGPKTTGLGQTPSPVHSLAVHSQELWGLSGTAVSYSRPSTPSQPPLLRN